MKQAHHDWTSPLWTRLRACDAGSVSVSVIVESELRFGTAKHPGHRHQRFHQYVLEAIQAVPLPFELEASWCYGQIRADLERRGQRVQDMDMLIAAHAMMLDATLVSDDRAFARIRGLKLENWLMPAPSLLAEPRAHWHQAGSRRSSWQRDAQPPIPTHRLR